MRLAGGAQQSGNDEIGCCVRQFEVSLLSPSPPRREPLAAGTEPQLSTRLLEAVEIHLDPGMPWPAP